MGPGQERGQGRRAALPPNQGRSWGCCLQWGAAPLAGPRAEGQGSWGHLASGAAHLGPGRFQTSEHPVVFKLWTACVWGGAELLPQMGSPHLTFIGAILMICSQKV